ncbi:TonB-dependent receptor [Sphingomonas tabacisoli]|uniref:TonB-dependent receptor n=1 Tax=Sphingomonas tabacisoli TaxID=2249466 RepID=A0ABW4I0H8_9SPHN
MFLSKARLLSGVSSGPLWPLVLLASALPASAHAQTQPDPAAAEPAVATRADGEDIIVSARRRNERLLDVPVAATGVTVTEIRQYNIASVADIKLAAPQISFDRGFTGGGASISLRGVSTQSLDGGLEQSVLVDLDGLPTSRGRLISDGLFDVATIEVLKGPQALFFGKNTPGGVVSIKSADPGKEVSGFMRAGYEFHAQTAQFEGAIGGPISDTVGARIATYYSSRQGYIHNQDRGRIDPFRTARLPVDTGGTVLPPAPRLLGAERRFGVRGTLRYENGDKFDATLKLLYSSYVGQGMPSLSEVMACPGGRTQPVTSIGGVTVVDPTGDCKLNDRVSNGAPPPDVIAAWPEVRNHGNGETYSRNRSFVPTLNINYKLADDISMTSVTGLYKYDYVSQGNADATSTAYFWSYSNEKNKSFVQEVRVLSSFDGPFNFTLGGLYAHDDRTALIGAMNGPAARDPATGKFNSHDNRQENTANTFSVFAQASFKPIDTLEISGGARYTHERKTVAVQNTFVNQNVAASYLPMGKVVSGRRSQSNVSPEATISWHATPEVMVYGAYKTGYLSGGFSNPGTLTPTISVPSLSFDAEKVKGFEGGVKFDLFDRAFSGSLIGYRYHYKGLQLTGFDITASPPQFRTQNAASTLVQGVEFETTVRPAEGLAIRGSVFYNDAHFESFPAAQCYAGQTAALGCNVTLPGTATRLQDLSGKDVYRSPDWIWSLGGTYDFGLGSGYSAQLNANVQHTSSFYASLGLNPTSFQKGYKLVNAGARLRLPGDRWTFAIIGRNLTNSRYATIGVDKPGGLGETFTVAGEPRSVFAQIEYAF